MDNWIIAIAATIQAVFTFFLFLTTKKYTAITNNLSKTALKQAEISSQTLNEMKIEREYRETPDINIRFKEENDGSHTLEFKNDSKTEIYNLRISVEKANEIMINKNCKLSDYGFLKNEIKYMGVNQVYQIKNINMYNFISDYEHIGSLKFSFEFYSKNQLEKPFIKDIEYNLSQFKDTATVLEI